MYKSTALAGLVGELDGHARARGLTDTAWSAQAGLRKESLSRLRQRTSCDFRTLTSLAGVLGLKLSVTGLPPMELTLDGHFPAHVDRNHEARLVQVCASGDYDPRQWREAGPPFFMAGIAVMLASMAGLDRRALLDLAERLHPGASEPAVFSRWLKASPVRPSRFLPLLSHDLARSP